MTTKRKQGWPSEADQTYQGWTNRETWAAHLWITNHPEFYREFRGSSAVDLAKDFDRMQLNARVDLGDSLRTQMLLEIGSLWRVNWQEIADALKGV
jgi:hypothetical protein